MKIALIGGGNMATALITGLFAARHSDWIQVAEPGKAARDRLEEQWPVSCFERASDAIDGMDAIVLAVKPQVLPEVLDEIGLLVTGRQLIISIVAGAPIRQIAAQIKSTPPIIRTMPNTPALIGLGITGMYAQESCTPVQKDMAVKLMQAAGEIVWLDDEDLLDVVTAVSGSGPAYFYYLIETIRNAGTRLGLPEEVATKLALHTARGAGALAVKSEMDVIELRRLVSTRGGTTEAALQKLESEHFENLVDSAISAATVRSRELADIGTKS